MNQQKKKESSKQIWTHNGLFGSARMMISQANAVIMAPTTTEESKNLARKIMKDAMLLDESLQTRKEPMIIDPQSTVTVTLGNGQYLSIDKKNNLRLHQTFKINGTDNNIHINLGTSKDAIARLQEALDRLSIHAS